MAFKWRGLTKLENVVFSALQVPKILKSATFLKKFFSNVSLFNIFSTKVYWSQKRLKMPQNPSKNHLFGVFFVKYRNLEKWHKSRSLFSIFACSNKEAKSSFWEKQLCLIIWKQNILKKFEFGLLIFCYLIGGLLACCFTMIAFIFPVS